ncbi:VC2046/SO_2500 family protein [Pseudoalteromonas pernae]|uniref:VC2046/SO_2500 family protein n=1 Tax=Pseudoalteromonas pernae TaxID=3118054 RepID=UPI0032426B93
MQIESILSNELQLGTQLNKCVQEQRRGDFAWLLASISHDALDFAQFHLPVCDNTAAQVDEQQLRMQLGAARARPCAPEHFNIVLTQNQCEYISTGLRDSLRLQDCLAPTPLAIRNDLKHIPLPIIDNCEPRVQAKYQDQSMSLNEPQMDSAAFYDQLNDLKLQGLSAIA